jgi:hypothetical protein
MLTDFSNFVENNATADIDENLANLKMVEREMREQFCINADESLANFV